MNRTMQPALTLYAIGLLGLGVLALVCHDFALDWQPVPPWVPGRTVMAYGSGLLMICCGAGLLFRPTAVWPVRVLFPYLVLWVGLKVPALFAAPGMDTLGNLRQCCPEIHARDHHRQLWPPTRASGIRPCAPTHRPFSPRLHPGDG